MSSHDELRIALGAYALGTLEPDERAAVEAHLSECPECREELEQLAPVPGYVSMTRGIAAGGHDPTALLEDEVLASYAATRRRRTRSWAPRLRVALPSAALGAAAAVAVLALAGGDPPATQVALTAASPASRDAATARVTRTSSGVEVALDARLAPTRRDQMYELWLVGANGRVSAGTFRVGAPGQTRLTLSAATPPAGIDRIGITLEPDDGDPARNGPTIVAGHVAA